MQGTFSIPIVIHIIAHLFHKLGDKVSAMRLVCTAFNFNVTGTEIPSVGTQTIKCSSMKEKHHRWTQHEFTLRLQPILNH